MFLQCVLISWLIFLMVRHFTKVIRPVKWHLGIVAVLSLTTALGSSTALIIPDIFTSVVLLCSALLIFAEHMNRGKRIALFCILTFALTTHLSHFPMFCALLATCLLVLFFRRKNPGTRYLFRKTIFTAGAVPAAVLLTLWLNYSETQQWKFSPGSGHVFLINRMWQCGILEQYLDAQCPTNPNTICDNRPYKDQDLLWDPLSPVNKVYGWENDGWAKAKPEYDRILSEIFSTPDYLMQYIGITLRDASKQLVYFDAKPASNRQDLGPAIPAIEAHYKRDNEAAQHTRQINGELNYGILNIIQRFTVGLSFLVLIYIAFRKQFRPVHPQITTLFVWVLGGMLFNALTVVAVAMIDSRYQLRLVWLLPLLVSLFLANYFSMKKNTEKVSR